VKVYKPHKNNIASISFLGFIAVLPFLDILGPIMLVVTIVMAFFFKPQRSFLNTLSNSKITLWLVGYFLLAVISLSYSIDTGESMKKLSKLVVFVLLPLMFALIDPDVQLLNRAKKVFVYAMMVFSLFSLAKLGYNYIVRYEISHWYNFVQDSMYHKYMPEDAMYLNTALVLLLFGKFNKNIKIVGAGLFFLVIVLFGVRLGLFLYLLIIFIYFIMNIKSFLNLKTLIVGIGILILSFSLLSQSRYAKDKLFDSLEKVGFRTGGEVSEIGEQYHKIGLRTKIWTCSLELIEDKPIFGYGAGVEKEPIASINARKNFNIPTNYNSHNQLLSLLVQYGIIGLAWVLTFFGYLVIISVKKRNYSAFLILTVMFISMITESYLEIQQGVFYFCFFALLLEKFIEQSSEIPKTSHP
jgi:O-antigen ligase